MSGQRAQMRLEYSYGAMPRLDGGCGEIRLIFPDPDKLAAGTPGSLAV